MGVSGVQSGDSTPHALTKAGEDHRSRARHPHPEDARRAQGGERRVRNDAGSRSLYVGEATNNR